MRKNANEKWRRRLSEIQSWLLRRTALYSCSSSGYSSSRSSEGNTMMASSAFVGDTSRPAATRCYIKTCQLQRRFIDFDSSLPYFNRPIVVHQERSDSLCQNCANVWFNEIFLIFQLFFWIRKEKIQVATWLRRRWAYIPLSFETKASYIFTLLEVNEDVLCANKASGRIFQYGRFFLLLFRSLFRQNVAVDFKSNHGYGIKAQIPRWDDFLNCYIRPNFQFGCISLYFFLPSFIRKSGKRNPKIWVLSSCIF